MSNQTVGTGVGGWTAYGDLTPESIAVFERAGPDTKFMNYTPQKVSTQLVAGTNYRFICEATGTIDPIIYEAIVQIFQPLKGNPIVTHIHPR